MNAYRALPLHRVSLEAGRVLHESFERTPHVYFPNDALVSLVAVAAGGRGLEVGMVGRQGMVGVSVALGGARSPARALVQGSGTAMSMSAEAFRSALRASPALQRAAARYADVAMGTAMVVAACNNAHGVEARCARWLLMTSDVAGRATFSLTQSMLAQMLGVRRAGVNEAATALSRRGLIAYRRGVLAILDRPGLLAAACGCYTRLRSFAAH